MCFKSVVGTIETRTDRKGKLFKTIHLKRNGVVEKWNCFHLDRVEKIKEQMIIEVKGTIRNKKKQFDSYILCNKEESENEN